MTSSGQTAHLLEASVLDSCLPKFYRQLLIKYLISTRVCVAAAWRQSRRTHRQVSGRIQEDDEQRRRQTVVGLTAIGLDVGQHLREEEEEVKEVTSTRGTERSKVGSDSVVLVPGPASQVWTSETTTPL